MDSDTREYVESLIDRDERRSDLVVELGDLAYAIDHAVIANLDGRSAWRIAELLTDIKERILAVAAQLKEEE